MFNTPPAQPLFLHSIDFLTFLFTPPFLFLSFRFSSSVSSCAGDLYSLLSKLLGEREDHVRIHKYKPSEAAHAQTLLLAEIDSIMQKKDLGRPRLGYKTNEDAILARDRVHKFHQLESTVSPWRSRTVPARLPTTGAAQRDQQGGFRPHLFTPNKSKDVNVSSISTCVVWTVSFHHMDCRVSRDVTPTYPFVLHLKPASIHLTAIIYTYGCAECLLSVQCFSMW